MRFKLDSSGKCTKCKSKEGRACTVHLLVDPLFNASSTTWHLWFGLKKKYFILKTFQSVVPSHKYHVLIDVLLNSKIIHLAPFLPHVHLPEDFLSVVDARQPLLHLSEFLQHLQRQSPNHLGGFLVLQYCKELLTIRVLYPVKKTNKILHCSSVYSFQLPQYGGLKMSGMLCFFPYLTQNQAWYKPCFLSIKELTSG